MSRALRWVVSLALVVAVVWLADWRQVLAALAHVDPRWVVACVALVVVERTIVTGRWRTLLVAHDVHLGFLRLLRVQFGANFLGLFLPNAIGVDALRIAALHRLGVAGPVATAATLVERATQGATWLVAASVTIVLFAGTHVPLHLTQPILWITGALALLAGALALPGVWRRLRAFGRRLVPARVSAVVGRVLDATAHYHGQHATGARVGAWTIAMFATRMSYTKCIALALGVDVPLELLLVIAPLIAVALMLPITIGGLGVLEVGYVALMAFVGVPPAVAVGMGVVDHLAARIGTLPGALFLGDLYERRARPRQRTPVPVAYDASGQHGAGSEAEGPGGDRDRRVLGRG